MEHIISCTWVFIELLTCMTFLGAFLTRKNGRLFQISVFLIAWAICSLLVCLNLAGFGKQFWTIAVTTAASFLLHRGSWIKHILLIALCFAFSGVIDIAMGYGACALLNISYSEFVWKKLLYITVATTAKLIELFLSYIFWKARGKEGKLSIKREWLLLTVLFPAVSLLMMIVIFVLFQDRKDLTYGVIIFSIILAVANIAILYLIHLMENRSRNDYQIAIMNQQMEIQTKNIVALEKSYRMQRKASHEFSRHMQTISDLLALQHYNEVNRYIQELQTSRVVQVFAVRTNHTILDALLNQKYQAAIENNIQMMFSVNDLSSVNIPTSELVVIFSNLLDNAIEACEKLSAERIIRCSIHASESLFISIRNTSDPVIISNGTIETSKESKLDHGYGLTSVCRILSNLRAEYTFEYKDGWFQFAAEIPLLNT